MESKTARVIIGYSELSYDERKKVREFIQRFEVIGLEDRKNEIRVVNESVGPKDSNSCPCCGR